MQPDRDAEHIRRELGRFARDEWTRHFDGGWSELAAAPSSRLRRIAELLRREPPASAAEVAARAGTLTSRAMQAIGERVELMPVWALKSGLAIRIADVADAAERDRLEAFAASLAGVETPSASDVVARLDPLLRARFGARLRGDAAGEWGVPVEVDGLRGVLQVWFPRFSRGLACELRVPHGSALLRFEYWKVLGLGSGEWDLLRQDRLEQDLRGWLPPIDRLVAALAGIGLAQPSTAAA